MANLIAAVLLSTQAPSGAEAGKVTFYYPSKWEGNTLKCGQTYDADTGPWVALDISMYRRGEAECGDLIAVGMSDGSIEVVPALDSGYLEEYGVVADMPGYPQWRKGRVTGQGWVLNISAITRQRAN